MTSSLADPKADLERNQTIVEEHLLLAKHIDNASSQVDFLFSQPANQSPAEIRRVIALLEELIEVAKTHFQHEETLMSAQDFPGMAHHKRDHDYLICSLRNFTCSLSHGTVPFSLDMGVNLRSWLTFHIRKYDDVYVSFVESARRDTQD